MYKPTQELIVQEIEGCHDALLRCVALLQGGEVKSRDEKSMRTKLGALVQVMSDVRGEVECLPAVDLD